MIKQLEDIKKQIWALKSHAAITEDTETKRICSRLLESISIPPEKDYIIAGVDDEVYCHQIIDDSNGLLIYRTEGDNTYPVIIPR